MSESSSSSEMRVNYQDSKGQDLLDNKKPQSSDTDYYFNIIANQNKIMSIKNTESSSEFDEMLKETESSSKSSSKSSSESRQRSENIQIEQPFIKSSPRTEKQYSVRSEKAHTKSERQQTPPPVPIEEPKKLTVQETRMRKIELLRRLSEIKTKGYKLTKEYDFNSSLEEMEYEYELLKSFADKRNGVKLCKNGLLQAVSVIEFLNDRYDPFDFHLSGWGDHMSVEIENWEDVLEELYEKYKGSGKKMGPEIKLLYLIIASAGAFHFTKSESKKTPGLESIIPTKMVSSLISGKKEESQFVSPQELNIQKQKEEFKKAEQKSSMGNILDSQLFNPKMFNEPVAANLKPIPTNQLRMDKLSIRPPDEVSDILSRIHTMKATDTQDDTSSVNDRLVSETTLSESNSRKKTQKKKAGIVIE